MKIIVDAFGGDNAPLEILKGCAQAVAELDVDILLTGREEEIRRVAKENEISLNRMQIIDVPDVITMEEHAGEIMKSKSNSSMAEALRRLAAG
ncbi:MAG: phosphate--acyl-ACP acyltransferase, partial [Ruminococcaceae bacterium]|nr:phosphate--acyl-ACP acyltransferase [Oscillospiraceae bacterium]